jgi:lipopolysaccharide/colanic/teichoic acid biosynthesis glycosyltransferase
MTPEQRLIKRIFDIVASAAGLILLAPVMLIITILVRTSSPGPALFPQTRVGRYGRLFTCYKFRSMYQGSESGGSVTAAGDARVTPVGRWLRRLKLDELPQVWHVFTGEMSFVGPRPDVPGYADRLGGRARRILDLRPGITGPASLHFRNEEELLAQAADPLKYNDEVVWPRKVALNLAYIDNWSLLGDLWCIIETLIPVVRRVL